MVINEAAVPVHPAVAGAAEILGIDPMHVANEGVLVAEDEPLARAMVAGLLATLLIALIQRTTKLKSGESMGLVFTGFYGIGIVLLKKVQDQFGFRLATESAEELVNYPGLDAVVVSSPHTLHHEHARTT